MVEPTMDGSDYARIHMLVDDTLVLIFERIHFIDRLVVELVCKRWKDIAKNKSWSKFRRFSYKDIGTYTGHFCDRHGKRYLPVIPRTSLSLCYLRYNDFNAVFVRSAQWLTELDLKQFDVTNFICTYIISLLPNLVHLNFGNKLKLSGDNFIRIAKQLTQLRSLAFENSDPSDGFKYFLNTTHQLEYLSIRCCDIWHSKKQRRMLNDIFRKLPSGLKYIRFDGTTIPDYLLSSASEQCLELTSMDCCKISGQFYWKKPFFQQLNKFQNLQYLSINLTKLAATFSQCLIHLTNLRALDIQACNGVNTILQSARTHLHHLEHLGITTNHIIEDNELLCLAKIPKLCSLSLDLPSKFQTNGPVEALIEGITSKGILQFLSVTPNRLSIDSICAAILQCSLLQSINLGNYKLVHIQYEIICDTLDTKYGIGTKPASERNKLEICTKYSKKVKTISPIHPWLNLNDTPLESSVRKEIRFGGLKSKPKFVDDFA